MKSMKSLIWKLLRKNISAGQIVGYALANLAGLAIVMCAIRFYSDVSMAYRDQDSFVSKDYMIISRPVSTFTTLGLRKADSGFSAKDISKLEKQPWMRKVGAFTSANFSVMASMGLGDSRMSTYMFLESIPDDFLDIRPEEWEWKPGEEVPIIISREYLALYNFGFAGTRGLPQLSESIIGRVPITFRLSGNGRSEVVTGRIVGFSSRLNTIAVPGTFMTWANGQFAVPGTQPNPSRLILEVSKPGDPAIMKYMERHNYEVAGDNTDNSRATYFLRVITAIVITIGAVISLLAFFILTLSIFLLLQKSRDKLHNLMLLGYTPAQAAAPYYRLVVAVNAGILVLSTVIMFVASAYWEERLEEIGVEAGPVLPALLVGTAIVLAVTALNVLTIRRIVRKAF
ncbi:MAG: ABC transporter permease [Muribaculaceae bacterium]